MESESSIYMLASLRTGLSSDPPVSFRHIIWTTLRVVQSVSCDFEAPVFVLFCRSTAVNTAFWLGSRVTLKTWAGRVSMSLRGFTSQLNLEGK